MTIGVDGSDRATELQTMRSMRGDMQPIGNAKREARIAKAQEMMRQLGIAALYLDASTSLYYFTGLRGGGRERLHGAVIPAEGALSYICPAFEVEKTAASIVMPGDIRGWEEHEDRRRWSSTRSTRAPPAAPWPSTRRRRSSPSTGCARPATATISSMAATSPAPAA